MIGFLRAVFDRSYIQDYPLKGLISEELINTVKWVLPGILLFDGCRTRRRVVMVLVCLLVMYFVISVQVVRHIPFESAFGGSDDIQRTRSKMCDRLGYSGSDMSTFLAGASWGILATLPLVRRKKYKALILAAAGIVAFGQALTGGRVGYLAWGATGLVLCLLKWRKYLLLGPVIVMLLPIVFPGAADRMLTGFGETDVAGQTTIDDYSMTSGRTLIWPYVIDKIGESPVVGHGRLAMSRTGLANQLMSDLGESFPHAHNMYLETLLDNGILGSIPILLFWGTMLIYSGRLFRSNNRLCSAVGGVALALILAQFFAGIGSQHFYPRESTLGAWAGMFLSLRIYTEWVRARQGMVNAEGVWGGHGLQTQPAAITAVGV
ncbi:MAG: O-antigen ligase family protein [Phycisphaerae bacterium]|nr:O-antigen ligase family protein [Phycisphaerae bacterium]